MFQSRHIRELSAHPWENPRNHPFLSTDMVDACSKERRPFERRIAPTKSPALGGDENGDGPDDWLWGNPVLGDVEIEFDGPESESRFTIYYPVFSRGGSIVFVAGEQQ